MNYKRILMIVVGCICSIFVFIFLFFLVLTEETRPFEYVKFNNNRVESYVLNLKISDWQSVQLDEEHSMKIPDGWSLQAGELLALYDDTGKQIAFGKKYYSVPSLNNSFLFLSEYFDDQVTDYALLDSRFFDYTYNNLADTVFTFKSGNKIPLLSAEIYVHGINDTNSVYFLYFEVPTEELHEIVAAMIYSVRSIEKQ